MSVDVFIISQIEEVVTFTVYDFETVLMKMVVIEVKLTLLVMVH